MIHLNNFNIELIDNILKYRWVTVNCGCLKIICTLKKYMDNSDIDYYKYIITQYSINSYNDYHKIFDILDKHINIQMFLNLNYFNVKHNSKDLYKCLFNTLNPTYLNIKVLDFIPSNFDGNNGLNITKKYVNPSSLRYTSSQQLLYYFKKYLNQEIYKIESKSIPSPIITFNDNYIIDGKYTYMKHFLENNKIPIVITNIFYTSDYKNICNFINVQSRLIENNKFNIFNESSTYKQSTLKSNWDYNDINIFSNIDNTIKDNIKSNFKLLCSLYI